MSDELLIDKGAVGAPAPRHRMAGLDGIRAFAVTVVVLFHFGVPGTFGGYAGVDIFFVLSGFLITSLLLNERERRGGVSLSGFWGRRVRRLLPALGATLALIGVLLLVVGRVSPATTGALDLHSLRVEALAVMGYVYNWQQIFFSSSTAGYFSHGVDSPFKHLWSLAIEEQFYLVFPLLFVGLFALHRRPRTAKVLGVVALALAAASALEMALLYSPATLNRVYYGTDTRAFNLLIGVAAACFVHGWHPSASARRVLRLVAYPSVVVVLAIVVVLGGTAAGPRTWMFSGGFVVLDLATAALIVACVLLPDRRLNTVLGAGPVTWVGDRSYGIYLYHWPIFVFVSAATIHLSGVPLFGVRLAATLLLAALSFRFVESAFLSRRASVSRRRQGVLAGALAGVAVLALVLGTTASLVTPPLTTAKPVAVSAPSVAHPGPPLRLLLLGDSMSGTLGIGLKKAASMHPGYNVAVFDGSTPGCAANVSHDPWFGPFLVLRPTPPSPCASADGSAYLADIKAKVAAIRPDVVVYVSGTDQFVQYPSGPGSTRISVATDPALAAAYQVRLTEAVAAMRSEGAGVILGTPLWTKTLGNAGDANDDPAAIAKVAAIQREVAAATPGVEVFEMQDFFGPAFTTYATGSFGKDVQVRCGDGIHLAENGGVLLASSLFDQAWSLSSTVGRPQPPGTATSAPGVTGPSTMTSYYTDRFGVMRCPALY